MLEQKQGREAHPVGEEPCSIFLFVIQASTDHSLHYLRGLGFRCLGEMDTKRGSKALKQVLGCTHSRAGPCQRIFVLSRAPAAPRSLQPSGRTGSNTASSTPHPRQSHRAPAPSFDSSEAADGSWAALLVVAHVREPV